MRSLRLSEESGYPVYGANGIIGFYDSYNHEQETVAITCRGATCGTVNLTQPKSYITGNAMCLDDVDDNTVEIKFLFYAMQSYDFTKVISGSAQPQITREGLGVFVEKKPEFAVKAKELQEEIRSYLGIRTVTGVRVLIRYDVENISDETFEEACHTVFAEPPVDTLYQESFETADGAAVFGVEFLPGQFDQRADSAVQCVQFLNSAEKPVIRTAVIYVIEGNTTEAELASIKAFCINPVDSRETAMEKPETLVTVFDGRCEDL